VRLIGSASFHGATAISNHACIDDKRIMASTISLRAGIFRMSPTGRGMMLNSNQRMHTALDDVRFSFVQSKIGSQVWPRHTGYWCER